jgi:pyroglutamyl-peptidase
MGKKFQLEQCAYNEAHFRIPDERGYQPRNKKIVEQGEATLYTRLRLEDLCSNLNLESAVVSTDPGRFVCNYTYYCSLHRFQKKMNVYTLFLHVPPFAVIPEAEQMQVVTKVMQEIEKQLTLET